MPSYYYHICSMCRPVTLIDSANSLSSDTFLKEDSYRFWSKLLKPVRHMTEMKPNQQENYMAVLHRVRRPYNIITDSFGRMA